MSSALFIGFFHNHGEPIRSSVRAFATYRLYYIGFMLGIVAIHGLLGSTRLSVLQNSGSLSTTAASMVAGPVRSRCGCRYRVEGSSARPVRSYHYSRSVATA